MKKEYLSRISLIDGSVEEVRQNETTELQTPLTPVYEEIIVQVLTLDGVEVKTQKRLIGFEERKP